MLYFRGGVEKFPNFQIPRLCPFVLLVEVYWGEVNVLGSEEGKHLRGRICSQ
jgi:hypothetical protein